MRSAMFLAAILAFGLGGQTCSADPITYNFVDYSSLESGYTLSGTITTDGTIGELSTSNILSFSFTFTEGATTYSDSGTSNNANVYDASNASVVASATAITLAIPTSGNYAQLNLSGVGGDSLNYE